MKKLSFKEDKFFNKNIRSDLIPNQENTTENKRGRQMVSRKILERAKNPAGNSLKSSQQTTTCESRHKKTKKMKLTTKMKRFIKKKIKESKSKSNFLTVEEQQESSDSDSLYKYKRRKVLYDYEIEFSQRQNLNFLDLESHDENKENSEFSLELNIDNEEILNDEIEKILLDVYNANILNNLKSKEFFLTKYERNVRNNILNYSDKFLFPQIK
jgi:hypothetical protein